MWMALLALWERATWRTPRDLDACRELLLSAATAGPPHPGCGRRAQVAFVGSSFHVTRFDPWRVWQGCPSFRGVLLPLANGTLVSGRFNPDLVTQLAAFAAVMVAGLVLAAMMTVDPGAAGRTLRAILQTAPVLVTAAATGALMALGIVRARGRRAQYRCLRATIDGALSLDSAGQVSVQAQAR